MSQTVVNTCSLPEGLPQPSQIVVIRSGAIGDTLMITPLLRSLRSSFPKAHVSVITSLKALDVLRHNPHIDEAVALRGRHLPFFLSREKQRLSHRICGHGSALVLSLEADPDFTALARRFDPTKLVSYDPRAGRDTVILSVRPGEHSVEMHLRAGAEIGAIPAGLGSELICPSRSHDAVKEWLAERGVSSHDTVVGIHAGWGGRKQHPENTRLRSWPASRFSQLISRTSERKNLKFVLTGSPHDHQLNETIIAASGRPALNAAGRFSLLESAALVGRMNLYVTIDSGPAHIAAAVGTPLITLWGPGIFSATRPLAGKAPVTILRSPPPCAPCYGTDRMKSCRDNICMKNIDVETVAAAVRQVLN